MHTNSSLCGLYVNKRIVNSSCTLVKVIEPFCGRMHVCWNLEMAILARGEVIHLLWLCAHHLIVKLQLRTTLPSVLQYTYIH